MPTQNPANPTNPCVLAIDPGRSKCGIAVVTADGRVLFRGILSTPQTPARIVELVGAFKPESVITGDGTGSAALRAEIEALALPLPVSSVDERHTSELARARYLLEHPAKGLRRLLPAGLRTPDEAYDDYVAIILAERWWLSGSTP
jgi:RNase H-fold protein (predicted Holliday junction resolvase)